MSQYEFPGALAPKSPDYTREQCIEDILNIAEEFSDNKITRNFYRNHSHITETSWSKHFGTFSEFTKAAGINHSRYATKILNASARHSSVDNIKELAYKRTLLSDTYLRDNDKRFKVMVAASDFHDMECDPFYMRVLTETIKNVTPDVVCLNGDIFDLPEFGRYSVDPREWDVVKRMEAGFDILRRIREAAPDAQIDMIEGNHEARMIKHLVECSPAIKHVLSGVHDFNISKLFKLDDYEINYVANADLHTFTDAQMRKEMIKNYKQYWGCLLAHHFPSGKQQGMPGFNGHHHKHVVSSEYNARYGSYEWHGMGGGHIREASYCDGSKWNNGFLVIVADTQSLDVCFDYCTIGSTFAVATGKIYSRNPDEFYNGLIKELDMRRENNC